jgi:hypothetical protein
MIIENSKRIRRIKTLFYLGVGLLALAALVFILIGLDLFALISGGVVVIWFLVFQYADFQYIWFTSAEKKVILRFYQAVKYGRKDYQTIEFPVDLLQSYRFENAVFGLVKDLILVVRTRKGVAEYPPVSLAALSGREREQLEEILSGMMEK